MTALLEYINLHSGSTHAGLDTHITSILSYNYLIQPYIKVHPLMRVRDSTTQAVE